MLSSSFIVRLMPETSSDVSSNPLAGAGLGRD